MAAVTPGDAAVTPSSQVDSNPSQRFPTVKMSAGLAVLKALASSCSVIMILSSAPSIRAIHKHRETGDVALFPLVGLWLNCVMV
ncbi:hypothetical protein DVH05_003203 [Phytophthora capsici]|nr:hypothetical protein DVH05_003203 [Phytophthora capsici]